jgi:hypothetical protein
VYEYFPGKKNVDYVKNFERDLLNMILPFPKSAYTHDHWIELVGKYE